MSLREFPGPSPAEVEMVEIVGLVDDRGRAHHAAVVVDEDVAHDGEHPSLEVGVLDIFVGVVEGFQRGILKQIVGIVAVRCEHEGEVEEVCLKSHESGLKVCCSHCSEVLEV